MRASEKNLQWVRVIMYKYANTVDICLSGMSGNQMAKSTPIAEWSVNSGTQTNLSRAENGESGVGD